MRGVFGSSKLMSGGLNAPKIRPTTPPASAWQTSLEAQACDPSPAAIDFPQQPSLRRDESAAHPAMHPTCLPKTMLMHSCTIILASENVS